MRFDRRARLVWAERLGVAPPDDPRRPRAFEVTGLVVTPTGIRVSGTYIGQMVVPEAWKDALSGDSQSPPSSPRTFVLELSDEPR